MAAFISIEGQDGAGKTSNIASLCDVLEQRNISYITTREPGGTEFGEQIRQILLNRDAVGFGSMAELLLMFAARAQHLEELIKPALDNDVWVLKKGHFFSFFIIKICSNVERVNLSKTRSMKI